MPESLLSPSQIKLFGRLFAGLQLVQPVEGEVSPNPTNSEAEDARAKAARAEGARMELERAEARLAEAQLSRERSDDKDPDEAVRRAEAALEDARRVAETESPSSRVPDASPEFDLLTNQLVRDSATLARIYGFSHEGNVVSLPSPTVFLVHGPGRPVPRDFSGFSDVSGVARRDWAFEDQIHYWEYDRVNYSMRLDIVSGTLDDILIQACIDAGFGAPGSSCGTDMVSRGTDLVSRGTDMTSRGTDMVSRGTDMVSRSRHRMG